MCHSNWGSVVTKKKKENALDHSVALVWNYFSEALLLLRSANY